MRVSLDNNIFAIPRAFKVFFLSSHVIIQDELGFQLALVRPQVKALSALAHLLSDTQVQLTSHLMFGQLCQTWELELWLAC